MKTKPYAVRRFAIGRQDRQNFEMYDTRTGECASFPGTKRDLVRYARQKNAEHAGQSEMCAAFVEHLNRQIASGGA